MQVHAGAAHFFLGLMDSQLGLLAAQLPALRRLRLVCAYGDAAVDFPPEFCSLPCGLSELVSLTSLDLSDTQPAGLLHPLSSLTNLRELQLPYVCNEDGPMRTVRHAPHHLELLPPGLERLSMQHPPWIHLPERLQAQRDASTHSGVLGRPEPLFPRGLTSLTSLTLTSSRLYLEPELIEAFEVGLPLLQELALGLESCPRLLPRVFALPRLRALALEMTYFFDDEDEDEQEELVESSDDDDVLLEDLLLRQLQLGDADQQGAAAAAAHQAISAIAAAVATAAAAKVARRAAAVAPNDDTLAAGPADLPPSPAIARAGRAIRPNQSDYCFALLLQVWWVCACVCACMCMCLECVCWGGGLHSAHIYAARARVRSPPLGPWHDTRMAWMGGSPKG